MRRITPLFLALFTLVLAGCQARTLVDMRVQANGTGTVTVELKLDKQAAAAVPMLAQQLRTGDLKAAGWSVDGPSLQKDGSEVVHVMHSFTSPAQVDGLFAQLTGPTGPFHDLHLRQQRSLTHVDTTFIGTIDLSSGIESFGDATLRQRTGLALGVDMSELQRNLGVDPAQTFPVDVQVHLPGTRATDMPPTGTDHVWHLAYGARNNLQARAQGLNLRPWLWLGAAVGFVIATLGIVRWWKPDSYRPRHQYKKGEGVWAPDLLRN